MPIEPDTRHSDAADLHVYVGLCGGGGDAFGPGGFDLFYAPGVGAGAQQTANVAENDCQVRDSFGEFGQFFQLSEEHPPF